MTVGISPIALLNVQSGFPESAELWDAITESQLTDWEAEWVPATHNALQQLRHKGVELCQWPQSRHWNWRAKISSLEGLLSVRAFSIMCQGITQGMMALDLGTNRCRIESQHGQHLVYVDYIENAPWNRPELCDSPKYRGIGSILIRAAIIVSQLEGFKGRIGLHSLPQSINFYTNTCQMTNLGRDSAYHNLPYFEMTEEQANNFVRKGDQK